MTKVYVDIGSVTNAAKFLYENNKSSPVMANKRLVEWEALIISYIQRNANKYMSIATAGFMLTFDKSEDGSVWADVYVDPDVGRTDVDDSNTIGLEIKND